MARTKLIFCGTDSSSTDDKELQIFCNDKNEIFISIDDKEDNPYYSGFICLDRATAIKFSKTLKSEIAKMESEVSNG